MKKSLFAIAAVTAFAGAAQAQSSVTVYGILDVGYAGGNSRVSPGGSTAVARATGNAFTNGAESTNRLGFKGSEDLGGGMSAFFTIEQAITPNGDSSFANSGNMNRQTFAGLKKNGLGAVAFGTQYTPLHNAVAATDAGNANNIMGDVIYVASTAPTTVTAAGASTNANNLDTNSGYTVRVRNAMMLDSDSFAGFKAHAMLVANNNNTNQTSATATNVTGGINNQNGWGLGLDYTWNKLFVTANYQALTSKNPWNTTAVASLNTTTGATATAAGTTGAATIWGVGGSNITGTNVQDNQTYVAGTYDFGILKAYAQWVNRKATSQITATQYVSRSAQQVGVRSFITPTIEAWASAGNGKYTAFGASNPSASFTGYQVGSNYWLSKRTNLYAIYGQSQTSNVAISTTGFTSTNANNYALGLRHTF
ncbi:porin [Polynucleobacter sp. JS-Mosq-20-D10]|uniref:porin n=1 Tax=Polynucleobacter sp. JS-Mosq-20-D10 TaxID=2576922 RepID=UPI001BFE336D|nr:porin [Polynucleobacter sp. JS-Mosq-20-D10]QWE00588.1 porin [Polynucleobacter sp. JS-Mosq-20-D10]